MFGSLGFGEILVICVVLILVVGPERLPSMMKQVGKAVRTVRQASRDIQATVGLDEIMREDFTYSPPAAPATPPAETISSSAVLPTPASPEATQPEVPLPVPVPAASQPTANTAVAPPSPASPALPTPPVSPSPAATPADAPPTTTASPTAVANTTTPASTTATAPADNTGEALPRPPGGGQGQV